MVGPRGAPRSPPGVRAQAPVVWVTMPLRTSQVRLRPLPSFSRKSTTRRLWLVVGKAAGAQAVQRALSRVAEGGMPQVVAQGDGLGQILVQPQRPGDGAGDLR